MTKYTNKMAQTEATIREALLDLMEDQPLRTITVSQITAKCQMNRGTFYRHFLDKYDIVERGEQEILDQLIANRDDLFQMVEAEDQLPIFEHTHAIRMLTVFKEHHRFLAIVLSSNGDPAFQERIESNFLAVVKKLNFNSKQDADTFNGLIGAYATSAIMSVIKYLISHPELDVEAVYQFMKIFIADGIYSQLSENQERLLKAIGQELLP